MSNFFLCKADCVKSSEQFLYFLCCIVTMGRLFIYYWLSCRLSREKLFLFSTWTISVSGSLSFRAYMWYFHAVLVLLLLEIANTGFSCLQTTGWWSWIILNVNIGNLIKHLSGLSSGKWFHKQFALHLGASHSETWKTSDHIFTSFFKLLCVYLRKSMK